MRIKVMLTLLVMLLPKSSLKNRALRALGHEAHPTARISPILVFGPTRFVVGEGAIISTGSVFKKLRTVVLDTEASIGGFNLFTAHPAFQRQDKEFGALILGKGAIITSRHYADCSGVFSIGSFAGVGGHGVNVLTHSMDFTTNRQSAGRISLGERSVVLGYSLLLQGAHLPDRSMLAAGAVCPGNMGAETGALYAGNPAKFKKHITGAWFDRATPRTVELASVASTRDDVA